MKEDEIKHILENIDEFILVETENIFGIINHVKNKTYLFYDIAEYSFVIRKMLERNVKIVDLQTYLKEYY